MYRISNFQVYCLMMILVGPVAFLEQPRRVAILAFHNAWLACLAVLLTGSLIIFMFNYIIKKSQSPFPYLLEEYFGKLGGRGLSFFYILIFLFITSYTLSLFVNFVTTNVLPGTPISILIAGLLLVGYIIIKNGLENFARFCEVVVLVGIPFSFLIVILGVFQTPDLENLLPIGFMNVKDFSLATISTTSVLGRLLPILTFAFFANNKQKINSVMFKVLYTYVALMTISALAVILVFGGTAASMLAFPVFSTVRLIDISEFITNVDILFIGLWIIGIVGALTVFWYMACFTSQYVFNLQEFKFLAAPFTLIIATTSLYMSENIIILDMITEKLVIYVYLFFLIFIPFVIFLKSLFKPNQPNDTSVDNYNLKL